MEMIYSNYLDEFPVAWTLHIKYISQTETHYDIRWDNHPEGTNDYFGELVVAPDAQFPYVIELQGYGRYLLCHDMNEVAKLIDQKLNPTNWKNTKQIAAEKRRTILRETMTDLGFLDKYNAGDASMLDVDEWEQVAFEMAHRITVLKDALVVAEKEVLGMNV